MPVDKFGRMSDTKTKDTGVSLTYINNNYVRSDGGTPLSGPLDMRGNTIYKVADPVNPQDVATKEYVDNVKGSGGGGSPFYKENDEYKTTHRVDMMFNKLVNLHKPIEPYDATTKDYVDYIAKEIREKLEKKPHLIAVHARYCGPLKKVEYHFKFNGGGNFKSCDESLGKYKDFKGSITGFVIPHSGHIKKIICEGLTFKDNDSVTEFIFNYISDNEKDLLISDIPPINKAGYTDIKDIIEKGIDELKKRIIELTANLTGLEFDFDSIGSVRFEIVKFEKSLNPKDYPTLKTQPKIISSVLVKKLKSVVLNFRNDTVAFGSIFRGVNNEYVALSEGDVINIKSMFDNTEIDEHINKKKKFYF